MLAVDEVIMRRREFVALIGATAAWYRVAEAQQARKYYQVGILTGQLRSEDEDTAAFVDEMHRSGFEEGRNLAPDCTRLGRLRGQKVHTEVRMSP